MTRTPHRTCPPMRARIAIVLVSAICILLNPHTLAYLQSRSAPRALLPISDFYPPTFYPSIGI